MLRNSTSGSPGLAGYADQVPKNVADREKWLSTNRDIRITPEVRTALEKWYGKDKGAQIKHVEAFEICEYGNSTKRSRSKEVISNATPLEPMKPIRKVAIIGGVRIPFVKSFKEYSRTSNQEMLTASVQATVSRFKMNGQLIGDVALGAILTFPSDWNLAREVVLGTDLDHRTPGFNLQRACGTSLEAVNLLALKIATGQIESAIAGGSDTNSDLPVVGPKSLGWKLIDIQNAEKFRRSSRKISKDPSERSEACDSRHS